MPTTGDDRGSGVVGPEAIERYEVEGVTCEVHPAARLSSRRSRARCTIWSASTAAPAPAGDDRGSGVVGPEAIERYEVEGVTCEVHPAARLSSRRSRARCTIWSASTAAPAPAKRSPATAPPRARRRPPPSSARTAPAALAAADPDSRSSPSSPRPSAAPTRRSTASASPRPVVRVVEHRDLDPLRRLARQERRRAARRRVYRARAVNNSSSIPRLSRDWSSLRFPAGAAWPGVARWPPAAPPASPSPHTVRADRRRRAQASRPNLSIVGMSRRLPSRVLLPVRILSRSFRRMLLAGSNCKTPSSPENGRSAV